MTPPWLELTASVILWASFVYHLIVGLAAIASVSLLRRIAARLYRLTLPPELDPRYEYTLKPLGIYALFLSASCWFAARSDVVEVRDFMLLTLAVVLLARALMRVVHFPLLSRAFAVDARRNAVNVGFNSALGLLLLSALSWFWTGGS